jgi:hypothetical protein
LLTLFSATLQVTVNFFTNLPAMFAVKKYGDVLDKVHAAL